MVSDIKDVPYPEISRNPMVTVILSVFLLTALYLSMGGSLREGPDGFTIFVLGYLILVTIAINESRSADDTFDNLITAFGFDSPMPGFNVLLAISGIGVGWLAFIIADSGMQLFVGSTVAASIFNPMYNTMNAAGEFALTTDWQFVEIAFYQVGVVGFFEELFKIIVIKNMANYFYYRFGWSKPRAVIGAMFVGFTVFGLWHWFSWDGLTVWSIMAAIIYSFVFYSPWLLAEITGAVSPVRQITLSTIFIAPAVTSHGTWNTLISTGGFGISLTSQVVAASILAIVPVLTMIYLVRQVGMPQT